MRARFSPLLLTALLLGFTGCTAPSPDMALNPIAEAYVKLVLAVGQHDGNYVDAYYGPPDWQTAAQAAGERPLAALAMEAERLYTAVLEVDVPATEEALHLRHQYLQKQLSSVQAHIAMLQGASYAFDDESLALYDAVAPTYEAAHFEALLSALDNLLPGDAPLPDRVARFKADFIIPKEKLDAVFSAAIAECRARVSEHMTLPPNENFEVAYVTDKPWSSYNWYQGKSYSLIQVNTDLPIYIDRAIDLAAHEGYPGHHVYNTLLEASLVDEKGWVEFSVYPLFSPQSLIAEGSANYGIDVVFPGAERLAFEREVLYPLAGLDASRAEKYAAVEAVLQKLSYADNEAARGYLNGTMTREEAVAWLMQYRLYERPRAEQRVRFYDTYRSYVINYNWGQDLVRQYIEAQGGTDDNPAQRWALFKALLSSPRLPSGLQ